MWFFSDTALHWDSHVHSCSANWLVESHISCDMCYYERHVFPVEKFAESDADIRSLCEFRRSDSVSSLDIYWSLSIIVEDR